MMKADFVCNGDLNKNYNDAGYAQEELLPGADLVNAKFYRYSLKAGNKVSPVLEKEKMVMLIM